MKTIRDLRVIRLTEGNRLWVSVAAAAVVAGVGGLILGRSTNDPSSTIAAGDAEAETAKGEKPGPEGFIAMSAESLSASGIVTERVSPGSLVHEIIAQATVKAPPEGQALLTARADGAVVRINKRLGDPVGAGETVALLESRDAAAFVAERNAAAARAQAARAAANREQRLFNAKITARQDLEAAVAAVTNPILLPGEPEYRARQKRLREGIPVEESVWQEIEALARELGVEIAGAA